ncbi:hypothetical protein cypCar_00041522 [Cyprinus carpio]|nr:hypothetical protein cypCar_00041522 [Cyprinus carpio]
MGLAMMVAEEVLAEMEEVLGGDGGGTSSSNEYGVWEVHGRSTHLSSPGLGGHGDTERQGDTRRNTGVFQKKKSQGDAEMLYSFPTRQARQRDSISTTYDTFVPSQPPGLDELIKLQQEVKMGSLSIDDALDRFNDWQRLQKGMDSIQQEKIQQLRASIISNREDDESVYAASANECRRASQQADTEFYSKPIKGQNSNVFRRADKHHPDCGITDL